jgi:hypothetical protein
LWWVEYSLAVAAAQKTPLEYAYVAAARSSFELPVAPSDVLITSAPWSAA